MSKQVHGSGDDPTVVYTSVTSTKCGSFYSESVFMCKCRKRIYLNILVTIPQHTCETLQLRSTKPGEHYHNFAVWNC